MKKGEHLHIYYVSPEGFSYTHHGIYCGDDKVIHYHKGKIRRTSKSDFSRGKKIYVKKYRKCASASVVVKRAKSRRGEKLYNLIFNNCEHFAHWCKTGEHKSRQVDEAALKLLNELNKNLNKQITKVTLAKIPTVKPPKIPKIKPPKISFKW